MAVFKSTQSPATKYLSLILLVGAVCTIGGYIAQHAYKASLEDQNDRILAKVNTIARSISPAEIDTLGGLETDITLPQYIELKQKLVAIREVNSDIRFIYLMMQHGDDIVFVVDSELSVSDDYSPPGQIYDEAQSTIYETLKTGVSQVEPFATDRWGTWVSALAKIEDPHNEIHMIVGVDVEASEYVKTPWLKTIPFLAYVILVVLLICTQFLFKKKELELITARSQFVSIASHELRSPLTGIRWSAERLLKDTELSSNAQAIAKDIHVTCLNLLSIVSDLLMLASLDNSFVDPSKFVKINLKEILEKSECNQQGMIAEKNIQFKNEFNIQGDIFVMGDRDRLGNLFSNLFSNAIKYSHEGGTVTAHTIFTVKNDMAVITIEDSGIGIPKDDQKRILEGFFRSENAKKHSVMGTGIGLYMCTKIVRAHGGNLTLTSDGQHGTTIVVTLPVVL